MTAEMASPASERANARAEDEWVVPEGPVPLDEVLRRFPRIRQSLAAKWDDCPLSTLFELRYARGWSTHPQARGTIFHRFAAECLREMQRQDSEVIPVGVALAILEETLRQRNVPVEDIVRVPLRELGVLQMAARKFAADNAFTIRKIIDVERRITETVTYRDEETGELIEREVSGQLDVLIAAPGDEAVVVDWKDTWALPPLRDADADDPGVSYHGYFQQRFYGWLVMKAFPSVMAVTLREFYARRTQVRPARITRQEMPKVEAQIIDLCMEFDRAVKHGEPRTLRMEDVERSYWKPSPGKHCHWCAKSALCPIDEDYRGDQGIRTPEDAQRVAAERTKAKAIHKQADEALKPYAELHGPIPLRGGKGRLVLGNRPIANGKVRWEEFTPEGVDRPPTKVPYSPNLSDAMREATDRARRERAV